MTRRFSLLSEATIDEDGFPKPEYSKPVAWLREFSCLLVFLTNFVQPGINLHGLSRTDLVRHQCRRAGCCRGRGGRCGVFRRGVGVLCGGLGVCGVSGCGGCRGGWGCRMGLGRGVGGV